MESFLGVAALGDKWFLCGDMRWHIWRLSTAACRLCNTVLRDEGKISMCYVKEGCMTSTAGTEHVARCRRDPYIDSGTCTTHTFNMYSMVHQTIGSDGTSHRARRMQARAPSPVSVISPAPSPMSASRTRSPISVDPSTIISKLVTRVYRITANGKVGRKGGIHADYCAHCRGTITIRNRERGILENSLMITFHKRVNARLSYHSTWTGNS